MMKRFFQGALALMLAVTLVTANVSGVTAYASEAEQSQEGEVAVTAGTEDSEGTSTVDTFTGTDESTDTEPTTEAAAKLDAPTISKLEGNTGKITVTWGKVSGAVSYQLVRSVSGGSYTVLEVVSSSEQNPSYVDEAVAAGNTYSYRVKAVSDANNDGTADSEYSEAKSLTYVAVPVLNSVANAQTGVKVTWSAVSQAQKYRVFRKTSSSSWTKLADVTGTSYTDTTAVSGTTYQYTVRCVTSDGQYYAGGYQSPGLKISYIAAPHLVSAVGAAGSVTVTWDKSAGAVKYRVFRKEPGGNWKTLSTVSSSVTSYKDTTVKAGTDYIYTVRCVDSSGSYSSSYDSAGLSIGYVATPVLSGIQGTVSGVKVTWNAVSRATKYRVFRKTSGGSWTKLADVTSTSYTDTTAQTGTTYIYTVRCIDSTTGKYASGYDSKGLTIGYVATPVLSGIQGTASGVKITWNAVSKAQKYRVFRKLPGGSWKKVGDTTSTSYTDTTAAANTTYIYTVRCIDSKASMYTSGYDSTGKTISYVATPKLTGMTGAASGIKITWDKVTGAKAYRVFRKTGSGSWVKMADVDPDTLSYTDKTVTEGTKYTYTVRCIDSPTNAKMYTSGYDSKGLSETYAATPVLTDAANAATGVKVTWSAAKGAVKYRVFRKTSDSSWKKMGDTTSTSYTDTTPSSGTTYIYTVRCITSDGKYYAGGYDGNGKTVAYLSAPKISGVTTASTTSAKVTWGKVTGAVNYRVFYKTSGSSWTKVGDTTSTSYTVTGLSSSVTYTFTVRCINSAGTSYTSGYDSSGYKYTGGNAMDQKAQSYSSSTKYLILVDTTQNRLGIYTGSKGNWTRKYYWSCTTGKASTPTVKGTFTVGSKGLSFSGSTYTCWYYTQFYGNYLFHSVLYKKGSKTVITSGTLGANLSHGCVRLSITNAKWIYDNIPKGTKVVVYK